MDHRDLDDEGTGILKKQKDIVALYER